MAKTSMVQREKHRAATVKKYAVKRAELKEQIRNPRTSDEARAEAQRQAAAAAAGCQPDAPAQSLRS